MATYINKDGLEVRFGSSQGARGQKAGVTTGAGKRRELVLELNLPALGAGGTGFTADLNNDGTLDGFNPSNTAIPANSVILSQKAIVLETPAGGTSYTVGTFQENGTVIDADGIRVAAGTDGAQVGTQLTQNGFVAAVATGTYTAGRIKLVIEYLTV